MLIVLSYLKGYMEEHMYKKYDIFGMIFFYAAVFWKSRWFGVFLIHFF